MDSVGSTLRRTRQAQGLDLAAVAALTKINAKYLEAIEADDRKGLPSGFFYKSFVHQYALALSLDAQDFDSEIDRVLSVEAPLPLPGQESAVSKNVPPLNFVPRFHRPGTYASFGALVLMVVGCSGVYMWWHQGETASHSTVARETAPAASKATAVDRSPSVPPHNQAAHAIPGYKVLLDLIAREKTWLSVSSDGKRVFSGILSPNQTKTVEGREFAKMTVGNAAGLEVRLNGKLLGPLGGRGQVLVVVFRPDNFQIVQPVREGD